MAEEKISGEISITTSQAQRNIESLRKEMQNLDTQFSLGTASLGNWSNTIDGNQKKQEQLTAKIEAQKDVLKNLNTQYENAVARNGESSSSALKYEKQIENNTKKLESFESQLEKTNQKLNELKSAFSTENLEKFAKSTEKAGKALSVYSAAVVAGATASAKAAIDWESSFAGVQKTVDGTAQELGEISEELRAMSLEIPITANELASIAENAGQLGIETQNITSFTRVMADLGVATNLTGDEAATAFAKFANITGMPQTEFEKMGSTIVALGNNLATTEADIASMATNLAAAGKQAGMSEAEILGLSGALSSVGLEAQAGGTAFSKIINQLNVAVQTGSDSLSDFASIAGMSASQFSKAFQEDATSAILAFVAGLGNVEQNGATATVVLEELGITETRLRDALTRASEASDLFNSSIDLANTAWAENNALTNEAATRYATTESQLQMAKNSITDAAVTIGQEFLPAIVSLASGVKDVSTWIANMDEGTKSFLIRLLATTAAVGPLMLIVSKGVTTFTSMKKALDAATTAQSALNVAMNANVMGAIAVGAAALIAVVWTLVDSMDSASESAQKLAEASEATAASLGSSSEMLRAIERYNQLRNEMDTLALTEEQLAAKQAELNELQAWITANSEGVITATADQTEAYNEQLTVLQNLTETEQRLNELRSGEQITEAIATITRTTQELSDANITLEATQKDLISTMERESAVNLELVEGIYDNVASLSYLKQGSEQLEKQLSKQTEELEELTEQQENAIQTLKNLASWNDEAKQALEDLGISIVDTMNETDDLTYAIDENTEATEENAEAEYNLEKSVSNLKSAYNDLNGVLQDVADGKELNALDALDLISTYPELADAISVVNGALYLEEEAVSDLLKTRIQAEIDTIDAEIIRVQGIVDASKSAIGAMAEEGKAVAALTKMYANHADDKIAAKAQSRVDELEKQKAILESLKNSVGNNISSNTKSSSSGGSSSSSTSKTKTDEEIRLETYKEIVAEMDYLRNIDELNEEDYYDRLKLARDNYLEENSTEWRKASEAIYKHEKDADEQAAQDKIDAYKSIISDLDHLRAIDEINDEEYYDKLAKARDEYLEVNSDEWLSATEKHYAYQKQLREEEAQAQLDNYSKLNSELIWQYNKGLVSYEDYVGGLTALRDEYLGENVEEWQKATESIIDIQSDAMRTFQEEWQDAIDTLMADYDSMVSKLQGYGDLFTIDSDTDKLKLEDLSKQTETILQYGEALASLQDKEIPDDLLSAITDMDVENGLAYASALLKLTDEEYEAYIKAWQEKQDAAADVASKFYQSELDALNEEFISKLPEELSGMKSELESIGSDAARGLADGIYSQADYISGTLQSVVNMAIANARSALEIHSPSRVSKRLLGQPFGQGIAVGIEDSYKEIENAVSGATSLLAMSKTPKISDVDKLNALNGMIGSLRQAAPAASAQASELMLQLDGETFGRLITPYIVSEISRIYGIDITTR